MHIYIYIYIYRPTYIPYIIDTCIRVLTYKNEKPKSN